MMEVWEGHRCLRKAKTTSKAGLGEKVGLGGSSKGPEAGSGCPWGQETLDSHLRVGVTSPGLLPQAEACPTATAGCSRGGGT